MLRIKIKRNTPTQPQQAIQQILGWSDEQLFDFKADTGIQYLRNRYGQNQYTDYVLRSWGYWKWFLYLWQRRDQEFYTYMLSPILSQAARFRQQIAHDYKQFHLAHMHDFYPTLRMLKEWYLQGEAATVGKYIDQLHQNA
jgi:hypothetical protein